MVPDMPYTYPVNSTLPQGCCVTIVLRSQTAFSFYIGTEKKGSGTSNSKFLFKLPPELGWAMIGDN